MAIPTDRISAAVREQRERLGYSRERLANLCEVSVSTITRLELNSQLPSAVTMFAIAAALGLDLNVLTAGQREDIPA